MNFLDRNSVIAYYHCLFLLENRYITLQTFAMYFHLIVIFVMHFVFLMLLS